MMRHPCNQSGAGYAVTLDGRPIKTPERRDLVVPSVGLADAIAAEWQAQGEAVEPATMRLSRIACTALDRIGGARTEVIDRIATFGETDLVCYRASEPAGLVAREAAAWDPLLDWLARHFDVRLTVVTGLTPATQPDEALERLRRAIDALNDMQVSGLSGAAVSTGSLVIGLALCAGRLDGAAAFEASQIEESYQIERWGADPETTARRAALRAEIDALAQFLGHCRT